MEIKIEPDQVSQFVSEALLRQLDDSKREALITAAIKNLITPVSKGSYGSSSPLQDAFNHAIRDVAQQIIRKDLEENAEIQQQVRGLITEAVTLMTTTNRDSIVQKMSEAIYRGMTSDRY